MRIAYISASTTVPTSRQIADYLLCGDCEHRFNVGGEAYLMTQVYDNDRFPLLDRLNVAMTFQESPELAVYSGKAIGVDTDRLIYFALSVFWRASVHRWRLPHGGEVHHSLHEYEEPVRKYLLGLAAFPPGIVVIVTACTDTGSQGSFFTPCSVTGDKYLSYGMLARGIHFRMFVGTELPGPLRKYCCATSERRLILRGDCHLISLHAFAHLHETTQPSRTLRT